jgi:nucleoid DNA-binding protein
LLPKSSRHFIQPTAEELNCDPQLVDDAVGFFYSEVRKALIEMKSLNIQLDNIGSFKVKPSEISKLLKKYEKYLAISHPQTFNQMVTKKEVERRLHRVKALQKMLDEEDERKKQFLIDKYGKIPENMAKPKPNSRRC